MRIQPVPVQDWAQSEYSLELPSLSNPPPTQRAHQGSRIHRHLACVERGHWRKHYPMKQSPTAVKLDEEQKDLMEKDSQEPCIAREVQSSLEGKGKLELRSL